MSEEDTAEWFLRYCHDLEEAVGRGWKRRLAAKVGVAETNVQTWLKSGRVPPAVRRAITLSDELEELKREHEQLETIVGERWIEVDSFGGETSYSVHEMDAETGLGRQVAGNIARIEDARELANLSAVKARIDKALNALNFENMYDHPEDQRHVKVLMNPGWDARTPWERRAALRSIEISDVPGFSELRQGLSELTQGKEKE
ncbi:hypothetical protein ABIA14_004447 [Sinorhizobium fredii]|uniref:hypothetical protein n=1 Tax=Rhizobium fredii TaxID=380 RepID=UPI003512C366